jgi:heme exporter protein A
VLTVNGLGKRYDDRWIIRNIGFTLEKGEALIVRGRNGSGKSTLLKLVSGLLPPSEGVVTGPPRLGYAGIDLAVYPQLTATEHLAMSARLRGCPERTEELLSKVGLSVVNLPAGKLSTGMRARLKLAIAIQAEPDLLLLDEPGAALDEQGRALIEQVVEEQRARGAAVIATNDPSERRLGNLELCLG